jgi:hypothetical protein
LKISQLVFNNGNWEGPQVVSEKRINESTNYKTDVDMSFDRFARTQNAKYTSSRFRYMWYSELLQYANIKTEIFFASGNADNI